MSNGGWRKNITQEESLREVIRVWQDMDKIIKELPCKKQ